MKPLQFRPYHWKWHLIALTSNTCSLSFWNNHIYTINIMVLLTSFVCFLKPLVELTFLTICWGQKSRYKSNGTLTSISISKPLTTKLNLRFLKKNSVFCVSGICPLIHSTFTELLLHVDCTSGLKNVWGDYCLISHPTNHHSCWSFESEKKKKELNQYLLNFAHK